MTENTYKPHHKEKILAHYYEIKEACKDGKPIGHVAKIVGLHHAWTGKLMKKYGFYIKWKEKNKEWRKENKIERIGPRQDLFRRVLAAARKRGYRVTERDPITTSTIEGFRLSFRMPRKVVPRGPYRYYRVYLGEKDEKFCICIFPNGNTCFRLPGLKKKKYWYINKDKENKENKWPKKAEFQHSREFLKIRKTEKEMEDVVTFSKKTG